jgi:transposase-like protein
MGQRRWSAADRQRAVSVYAARGLAAAARETGIPHPNIARWAKAAGVTTSPATPAHSAPEPEAKPALPPAPALPADLGGQLATVRTALLARVLAQLDQGRPVDLRAAAQLLAVVDDLARRHRPVPADAAAQLAELHRILDDLEGSNVRELAPRRKRRKA